ncbi:MAG: hypothetical protein KF782_24820, partial [Labilithrix sp.]|nr:hypothetical protein [Labilithrix sp.]
MSDTNPRGPTHRGPSRPAEERSSSGLRADARAPDAPPPVEELPDELVWAAGGHASDVVLTALADGQRAIVPEAARAHVERCATCTAHLGHAALLSLHAGAEIGAGAEHERALARRPLPRLAISLGLAV